MNYLDVYKNGRLLNPGRERSNNTVESYLPTLNALNVWIRKNYSIGLDDDSIMEIKGMILEAYDREVLGTRNYKTSTRNHKLKIIRQFFAYLYGAGYISFNPAGTLELIREKEDEEALEKTERGFLPGDVKRIVDAAEGRMALRDKALVMLIVGTGLRVSEACSLNVGQLRQYPQKNIYVTVKGGRRVKVWIAQWALPFIDEYMRAYRSDVDESEPLFVSMQGTRLTRYSANQAITAIERKLGLKTGVHQFRHTMVTEVGRAAGNLDAAQVAAHHKSVQTTEGYNHARPDPQYALDHNALAEIFGHDT